MFKIRIKEIEGGLLTDPQDMHCIYMALESELKKNRFLSGLHKGFDSCIGINFIEITYKGIVPADNATSLYMTRSFCEILDCIGMQEVCMVFQTESRQDSDDLILRLEIDFKPSTRNSKLLDGFLKNKEIPENYICILSQETMDDPVYTSARPDLNYEKRHLLYWLYSQDTFLDPFTKTEMLLSDIHPNNELKTEINTFVKEKVLTRLKEKHIVFNEKFAETVKKYASSIIQITQADIDKAFRNAAAVNNIDDLKLLHKKVSSINAQDDNPARKRTALHWAIEKGSIDCIVYLLEQEAEKTIPDAQGKTALSYANKSTIPAVRKLLLGEIETNKVEFKSSLKK